MLKLKDYFTIGNFTCGLLAIFATVKGSFVLACLLILLAVVFDFLDGRIARLTKTQNEFGKQLDSLSDLVSFGVWPSVFGYMLGLTQWYAVLLLLFFSVSGMLRLARFNIQRTKNFRGVPITTNGILFPIGYFILTWTQTYVNSYFLAVYLGMGLLMISNFRVKKL